SVGGGAVGERLLRAAVAASRTGALAALGWRLLAGPDLPGGVMEALRRSVPAHAVVERARPDFPALLRRCRLSVSQAGYNTALDVLNAGCRAVLVPFAADGETEQATRAAILAARGLATVVDEATLTPGSLAAGIAAALEAPAPARPAIAMDGAAETARTVVAALKRGRLPEMPVGAL
ncbi:MAG TPA: glycosyltransferase, partial [Alphaproteobacteria bacterium]|nr:glycosyltransferase [Alphaproteobacteria bacterium]